MLLSGGLSRLKRQQATGQFYNFSNIPYAQPPLGDLRFQAPVPFDVDCPTTPKPLNNGSRFSVCPQGAPAWTSVAVKWLTEGIGAINQSAGYQPPNITTLPTVAYGTSEDCLVLDILSPKNIFESRGQGRGAAVYVYTIYYPNYQSMLKGVGWYGFMEEVTL